MIVFDLKCLPTGHVFEAWFGSSEDFESQSRRGLVQCPLCDAPLVEKAVMAPRITAKSNRGEGGAKMESVTSDPNAVKAMLAAVAAAQKRVLAGSDFVGDRFSDEARAIHLGESDARSIHGSATRAQSEQLLNEGIKVAPLPFPVIAPGDEN